MVSFYDKEWLDNASIKVKFSPNLIYKEGVERCATIADELASHLMFVFNHAGVDGHLCKDFQGWAPEVDFLHNVKTRTRIKRALPSVGSLEGSLNLTHTELDFSDCAIRYNAEKSFLMGKKNSVQCALYSKMDEAKKSNKFKFWEEVYNEHMGYEKEKDVFRLEMRFPSTVLSNLGDKCKGGKGQIYGINSIKELIPHIPSLWKYALYDLFRYHYKDSNVVRPEWQLLADTPFNDLDYKPHTYQRVKITNTGTDSDKNISQMLGHLAAFMAKEGVTDYQAEQMLYNFPQRHILNSYFKQKGLNQEQWIQKFIEKVEDKRIDLGLVTESPFKFAQKYKNNEYEVPF
ncbi:hypothetical protein [Thiomicrorhabdus sp.]|uniref:hypothetical protein n=1 Tax=Thiomicrorhabdus sp. TaxID=2039724 RepID=UPI0029C8AC96|nr:hypothetical protein [Thiomicrorhabdus sp.]